MLAVPQNKGAMSIIDATGRLNIWEGSVRSSKTVDANIAWLNFVATGPPGPLLMTGKTRDTVHRNILDPMSEWLPEEDFDPHQNEIEIFGRPVYIVGANDEKAVKKIQGLTLIGAYADEIATLPESYFKMLLSRLSLPGARFFGTTNPDSPYHWLKVEYLDKLKSPHLNQFHFILEDNPHLPPEYVAALKEEYVGLWYRRYILGEWCLAEGSVYDMWDEEKHVIDKAPVPHADSYIIGIDYGTNNPCVFLMVGVRDDVATVEKEYYYDSTAKGRQLTDAQYSAALQEFIGKTEVDAVVIDPSAASFKVQVSNDGITTTDADNSVIDGIRFVSSMLQAGRLKISEQCPNLIKEFSSYVWDSKKQDKGEDAPMKQNDHALDALRYALYTYLPHQGHESILLSGGFGSGEQENNRRL